VTEVISLPTCLSCYPSNSVIVLTESQHYLSQCNRVLLWLIACIMLVIVFRYSVLCFADNDTLALRGNSIATKAVESYMKLVGQKVQALNIF